MPIIRLGQLELASARPTFDFGFAAHCVTTGGKALVVDQAEGAARASVAGAASILMHFQPSCDIMCPTGVDRTVGTKEEIYKGGAFPRDHVGVKIRPGRFLAFQV